MHHIAAECPSAPGKDEQPMCPTALGKNMMMLGIAEVPCNIVKQRFCISNPWSIPVQPWHLNVPKTPIQLWTDGSCNNNGNFWYCVGTYAVVLQGGAIAKTGIVQHIAMSAYTCEFWAILEAFCYAAQPVICYSDCLSLVKHIEIMIQTQTIDPSWPHFEWWRFFLIILKQRCDNCEVPLHAVWIPSHVLDDIPIHLISCAQARSHQTTTMHIEHNRIADSTAKKTMRDFYEEHNLLFERAEKQVHDWQFWLAHLNHAISQCERQPCHSVQPKPAPQTTECSPLQLTLVHPTSTFQRIYPKWEWNRNQSYFCSQFQLDPVPDLTSYASLSQEDWATCIRFLSTLQWKIQDSLTTAFVELAFVAYLRGFQFSMKTPSQCATMIRKVVNQLSRIDAKIVPAKTCPKSKCVGRPLPAGRLVGALPWITDHERKHIALFAAKARSHSLKDWNLNF